MSDQTPQSLANEALRQAGQTVEQAIVRMEIRREAFDASVQDLLRAKKNYEAAEDLVKLANQ